MFAKTRSWKSTVGLMWLGGYLTLIKNTISMFAVVWFYTQSTGSATILAFISAFKSIPHILIAPFGGVLADRFPRKRIFITANIGIFVLSLFMGFLFCTGLMKVPYMYILVFLTESFASFIFPMMQSSIPMVAPQEKITKLVSIMTAFVGLYGILRQIGGTLLIKIFHIDTIMFINAGIALTAVIPFLFIIIPQPKRVISKEIEKTNLFSDFVFGLKYVIKLPKIFVLLMIGFSGSLFLCPPTSLLPILVKKQGGGVEIYAAATVILMIAYLGTAVLMSVFGGPKKKSTMMFIALICASSGIVIMIVPVLPLIARVFAGCALLGCSISLYNVPFYTILSTEVEKEVQGRVIAVASALLNAATPLGLFIAGPLSDSIGIVNMFVICAVILIIISLIIITVLNKLETQNSEEKDEEVAAISGE